MTAPFALFLMLAQFLPTSLFYFNLSASLALGMTLTAVLIIFIYWARGAIAQEFPVGRSLHFLIGPAIAVICLFAFVLVHAVVVVTLLPIDLERLSQTLVPLLFLLVGGMTLGSQLSRCTDSQVDFAINLSFWCLCGMIASRVVGAEPAAAAYPKAMFPFTETSHFSLAFGPVLMYRAVRARQSRKLWWIFFGILVGAGLQSLNLLFYCLLVALVCRRLLLISLLGLVVAVAGLPLELTYFTSRLDFSSDSNNLSALVYLQGWQQILESLSWTSGWGLGFEQLGFRETESAAGGVIRFLTGGEDLNLRDGSFVLVKLVSEFGFLGVMMAAAFCLLAGRCARALRRGCISGAGGIFSRCVVTAYVGDLFVRSPGYFSGSTLLLIGALWALFLARKPPVAAGVQPVSGTSSLPAS